METPSDGLMLKVREANVLCALAWRYFLAFECSFSLSWLMSSAIFRHQRSSLFTKSLKGRTQTNEAIDGESLIENGGC